MVGHGQPPPAPPAPAGKPAVAFVSPDALSAALSRASYLVDSRLALVAWLALALDKPVLVEGPAGVGKTDLARALSEACGRPLVRLQCYEGLDEGKALYEWNYAKQMLYTQLVQSTLARAAPSAPAGGGAASIEAAMDQLEQGATAFFGPRFLLERPLLRALTSDEPVVLLIDEVDRADPEFEAFLLELLSERQVTIPELGTVTAKHPPLVVLTTNGTREMTDALRRRCLHAFVDYPPPSREVAILELRVPGLGRALAEKVADLATKVRAMDLRKAPSIAETIDWARALVLLGKSALDAETARETLGLLVKHEADRDRVEQKLSSLI